MKIGMCKSMGRSILFVTHFMMVVYFSISCLWSTCSCLNNLIMPIFVSTVVYSVWLWLNYLNEFKLWGLGILYNALTVFYRPGKKRLKLLRQEKLGIQFSYLTKPYLMFVPLLNAKRWTSFISMFWFFWILFLL